MVCSKNFTSAVLAMCVCVSVQAEEYVYTTLDVPGALNTVFYGIDGGNIVGSYSDSSGTHGFSYDGTTYTTLDRTGTLHTWTTRELSGNHGFVATVPGYAGDMNYDGVADNLDVTPFIGLLTASDSNATAVPEPGSLVWVVLALMMGRRRAVRR